VKPPAVQTKCPLTPTQVIEATVEAMEALGDMSFDGPFDVHKMRLIWSGKQLADVDDRTLAEYGIQDGDTIHMVTQLRGD
jgi:hypothetical protein